MTKFWQNVCSVLVIALLILVLIQIFQTKERQKEIDRYKDLNNRYERIIDYMEKNLIKES